MGGFEWGTFRAGAAQFALSLYANVPGDDHALAVYHKFKTAVVAHIRADGFVITTAAIDEWTRTLEEIHRVAAIPPGGMQFVTRHHPVMKERRESNLLTRGFTYRAVQTCLVSKMS